MSFYHLQEVGGMLVCGCVERGGLWKRIAPKKKRERGKTPTNLSCIRSFKSQTFSMTIFMRACGKAAANMTVGE